MIPNILTTFRLIIIPFFAVAIFKENVALAVALFLLSGATDIIDGWIARRFNMITNVGKVYDPLVDKLMQITAAVCLTIKNAVPFWVLCFILLKEVSMIVVSSVLYLKKVVVESNWYGKFATVYFYAVMLIFIVRPGMSYIAKILLSCSLVAVIVWAAAGYLIRFVKSKKKGVC